MQVTVRPVQSNVDLAAFGISKEKAAEIRSRFGAVAVDWDRPEMAVYDDYCIREVPTVAG